MSELYGLGGAGAIVTAGGILLWRYVRVILNTQDKRIKRLEYENQVCNTRVDALVGILRRAGIEIPASVWDGLQRTVTLDNEDGG